jgi:hypothetical protein
MLQWARENGCDRDDCTCLEAAGGGHLEVLQWARANGCDWDLAICLWLAPEGSKTLNPRVDPRAASLTKAAVALCTARHCISPRYVCGREFKYIELDLT